MDKANPRLDRDRVRDVRGWGARRWGARALGATLGVLLAALTLAGHGLCMDLCAPWFAAPSLAYLALVGIAFVGAVAPWMHRAWAARVAWAVVVASALGFAFLLLSIGEHDAPASVLAAAGFVAGYALLAAMVWGAARPVEPSPS